MRKKEELQKDFNNVLEQAKERFKKFGKEIGILAKKSEKEIIKASRVGRIQLDLLGLNMQREKLCYDIGKRIVSLNTRKGLDLPELEPYWKKMDKIERDARKKKKILSGVMKKKE